MKNKGNKGNNNRKSNASLTKKQAPKQKGKRVELDGTEDFDNDIDIFEKQRNKVNFDDNEEENDEMDQEESVFDLDVDEDEDENEDEDEDDDDDIMGENKPKEVSEKAWGKKKKAYYDGDVTDEEFASSDEDALKEEEQEVKRIQKQKLKSFKEEDFGDGFEDSFQSILKKGKTPNKKQDNKKKLTNEDTDSVEKIEKDMSKLSKEEILEVIAKDSPELIELLSEFKEKVSDIRTNLQPILNKVKNQEIKSSEGISFLELKYQLLLSYCTNIAYYLLLKSNGNKVKDHPVIEQLVELRTVIEKIKPIEQKLKYQIDKLVRIANVGSLSKDDPLRFKPNPSDLMKSGDNEEEERDDDENSKQAVYRPSKIAPVVYDEDDGKDSKKRKREQKLLEKASKNRIIKDLRDEFSDRPEEISHATFNEDDDEDQDLIKFEEENMTRVTLSKKDKSKTKKKQIFTDELKDLEDFGSFGNILEADERSSKKKGKRSNGENLLEELGKGNEDILEEDDFYEKVKKNKDLKKKDKLKLEMSNFDYDNEEGDVFDDDDEKGLTKRGASREMIKNRGLTPKRNKEIKNPRVKRRKQFEKASTKLKHVSRQAKSKDSPYQGELTGIKPQVSRSVKIK